METEIKTELAEERHRLASLQAERLAQLAHRALYVRNLKPDEFAIIAIAVDAPNGGPGRWRYLVDRLMPGHDWQQYRDQGQQPMARGIVFHEVIDHLAGRFPDLAEVLRETPAAGMAKMIMLDSGGAIVYDIEPIAEKPPS